MVDRDSFFDDGTDAHVDDQMLDVVTPSLPTSPTNQTGESSTVVPDSSAGNAPVAAARLSRITEQLSEPQSAADREYSTSFSSESVDDDQPLATKLVTEPIRVDGHMQTDRVQIQDVSMQTESMVNSSSHDIVRRQVDPSSGKTLLDQVISSAFPIVSFCQPYSMTSRVNDVILAMPHHLMIVANDNSVSIHPWQPSVDSTSTILECHWCSFLYKLLVTTLDDHRLFIYDFVSITDSIRLRGYPLSVRRHCTHSNSANSLHLLSSSSSRYQPTPFVVSQTRFTKSNSHGIYYCYISDRQQSCMLTRIDHNTREHVQSIDCTAGSSDNRSRICALGLSDDRVAIVLNNLTMIIYHAETLAGLKQINLLHWTRFRPGSVNTVLYLWRTWLLFDSIENKIVGIGKRQRQFIKKLPEQPINACQMDDGALALWLGYPGAIIFYRPVE
jgi:hypothetical protein